MHLLLALDTNVLFDRAANQDFAITMLDFINVQGIEFIITDTVLAELDFAIRKPSSPEKAQLAKSVLENLVLWGIKPRMLKDSDLDVVADVSRVLRQDQLLPFKEIHDGCILAEAAFAKAEFLVTSDLHLLSMDREKTKQILAAKSLPEVHVASPRSLYIHLKKETPL